MYRFDLREAREVFGVECENAPDSVDMHRGSKTGIVDLCPRHSMSDEQLAPCEMNVQIVGKKAKLSFNLLRPGQDAIQ